MGRKNGDGNYEVGYGRPPQRTRFQEGQSGNPKGRPGGSRNATTILNEALHERVVVTENGRRKSATKLEVIFKQLVNKAAQGDHRATQLLLNQMPSLEARAALLSAIKQQAAFSLPSPEDRRARNLEAAKILRNIGYLAPEVAVIEENDLDATPDSNKSH
jgi:Family of unknown function (DUF5681)